MCLFIDRGLPSQRNDRRTRQRQMKCAPCRPRTLPTLRRGTLFVRVFLCFIVSEICLNDVTDEGEAKTAHEKSTSKGSDNDDDDDDDDDEEEEESEESESEEEEAEEEEADAADNDAAEASPEKEKKTPRKTPRSSPALE